MMMENSIPHRTVPPRATVTPPMRVRAMLPTRYDVPRPPLWSPQHEDYKDYTAEEYRYPGDEPEFSPLSDCPCRCRPARVDYIQSGQNRTVHESSHAAVQSHERRENRISEGVHEA